MAVKIVPHSADWAPAFEVEAASIRAALGDLSVTCLHIGSTSVPGLVAKPVIDILMEVDSLDALSEKDPEVAALGYEALGAYGIPGRRYYRKDNAGGRRTHQIHAFEADSPHIVRHLAFRDYLRATPDVAAAYGALKLHLVGEGADMDAYIDGKDPFIRQVEADALLWRKAEQG